MPSLRAELQDMVVAESATVLARLQSVDALLQCAADAQLELEKRRWMLCTLQHLDREDEFEDAPLATLNTTLEDAQEALILFDSTSEFGRHINAFSD
jgi:hypothetical protein